MHQQLVQRFDIRDCLGSCRPWAKAASLALITRVDFDSVQAASKEFEVSSIVFHRIEADPGGANSDLSLAVN